MPRLVCLEAMCIALTRMTEREIYWLTVLYLRFTVFFSFFFLELETGWDIL